MNFFRKLWTSAKLTFNYFKMAPQLVIGAWKIGRLPQPVVSVFGGSRLKKESKYVKWAEELSGRLVQYEISVITGGGPGIMEAANCGAFKKDNHKVHTMGIGVRGVTTEEPLNACVKDYILTDYFAMRKYLLIAYSYAYVVFPGGFGTIDELAEVMTLMQTNKLPVAPIILIGEEYWSPFMQWVKRATQEGLIPEEHAQYLMITDDLSKATDILVGYCKRCAYSPVKK